MENKMADEIGIYAEDIVKNAKGTLGLVVQDAEETSDESDSEDEVLRKGQLLVCWYPSGREETVSISKVQLADRSLLPGDVVKCTDSTHTKQQGFISDVKVVATIKVLAANQNICDVDCRNELKPLQDLVPSVHVTLGPWLGVITESNQKLTLKMKNGSRCCLEGEQADILSMLHDMSDSRNEDSPFISEAFYPGQVLAGSSKTFKEAKWISGVKPIMHSQTQVRGTVEEIAVVSCEVNWQMCGASFPYEEVYEPPNPTIAGDQLQMLKIVNYNQHASIQIGDKAFYTIDAKDIEMAARHLGVNPSTLNLLPVGDHAQQNKEKADNCLSPVSDNPPDDGEGSTGQEEHKQARAKKTTNNVPNEESGPQGAGSDSTDEDPEGVHKSKGSNTQGPKSDSSQGPAPSRFPVKRRRKRAKRKRKQVTHMQVNAGDQVCVEVITTRTTVDVTWQDRTTTKDIPSTDLVPVFHLDEHEFFPGDYVNDKRDTADATIYGTVLKATCDARTCDVKWFTREGTELSIERDISVYDIAEHTDFVFNSGDIVVRMVPPDYCTSPTTTAPSSPTPCVGQVINVDEDGNVHIRWVDGALSHVIPQELYKYDAEDDEQSGDESRDGSNANSDDEWETASDVSSDEASHDPDDAVITNTSPNEAHNNGGDEENARSPENAENKANFDYNAINEMVSNRNPAFMILERVPEDHAYKCIPFLQGNRRKMLAAIQKELSLLHSSLPAGILVRSFEERVDLYRVMITGPTGTPYEHGLFIFDVRLPPNYSSSPPVFHYHSMCSGRLNPNLYEDGKVCVSLLGTWSGKGSEVWTPKSSVLQVLISIQGLILCDEPYFNEAGYEKQRGTREGVVNSRLYNEMVIIKLVQSMTTMISKPPTGFEAEIRQHFTKHVPLLLQKFNFWLEHNKRLLSVESERETELCNGFREDEATQKRQNKHEIPSAARSLLEPGPHQAGEPPDILHSELHKGQEEVLAESIQENGTLFKGQEKQEPMPQEDVDRRGQISKQEDQQEKCPEGAECSHNQPTRTLSQNQETHSSHNPLKLPDFPLFPLSKGFRKSLERCMQRLSDVMGANNLTGCLPAENCQPR